MRRYIPYALLERIILPRYEIIILICVALAAAFVALRPIREFHALERSVALVPVTPQKVKEWGLEPTRVSVGLYVTNFPELDFVNNSFTFDGIIWFEFDPALISLDTVAKFAFEKGEILQKSEPYTQIVENKFFARYEIRVHFKTDLDYTYFPFDDHVVYVSMINRDVQPSEMIYLSYASYFRIAQSIVFPGWSLVDCAVKTGYSESSLDEFDTHKTVLHPKTVFSIYLQRSGTRNILLILLPMLLIYILSIFSLSLNPATHASTILAISSASVTSLLAYRFVIENMTPRVGYFVLSDQIFILLLVITLAEFIFSVVVVRAGRASRFFVAMRGAFFLLVNVCFLIAWYLFLHNA